MVMRLLLPPTQEVEMEVDGEVKSGLQSMIENKDWSGIADELSGNVRSSMTELMKLILIIPALT